MWKTSSLNPKYEVNELGQVRNKQNKVILKGYKDKNGYIIFSMYDADGKRKDRKCHILVAYDFVKGRTQDKCYVNHKNFDKTDNRADNLEWVTHKENMAHWYKNQEFAAKVDIPIIQRESKLNKGKCPVIQYDLSGNMLAIYESYMDAQRATYVRSGNISLCCRGKRKTAGGYIWRDLIEGSTTIENTATAGSE